MTDIEMGDIETDTLTTTVHSADQVVNILSNQNELLCSEFRLKTDVGTLSITPNLTGELKINLEEENHD